jgi:hypothetical protein
MNKIKKILKNEFITYSIATILTILLAFSFVGVFLRAKEAYSIKEPFLFFCLFGSVLLFWLLYNKKFNKKIISILILFFFITIFFIINPPHKRNVRFDLGVDPFSRNTRITLGTSLYIWEKEFWMSQKQLNATLGEEFNKSIKKDRMLNNAGKTDVVGWTEEEVILSFGEPKSKNKISETEEIWYYSAWKDNPDWTMPVYMENGKLKLIGDEKESDINIQGYTSELNKATDNMYGYSLLYSNKYSLKKQMIGIIDGGSVWYRTEDFLLSAFTLTDPKNDNQEILKFRLLNTTDIDTIIAGSGFETAKYSRKRMVAGYEASVIKIESDPLYTEHLKVLPTEILIIQKDEKSYSFLHYLSEEEIGAIISTLKFDI